MQQIIPRTPRHGERVRVGLVGVGAWGRRLLRTSAQVAELDVRWVCDPRLLALPNPPTRAAARVQEILADPAVDALVIATPEDTHAELALAALDAGKFVFVEKPLCRTLTERNALARHPYARARLMVGHLLRYDSAFSALAKLNVLSPCFEVYSLRHSLVGARPGRCPWWSLAPHDISVLLRLWGAPDRVSVSPADGLDGGVDALLLFPGGRVARLSLSTGAVARRRSFRATADTYQLQIEDGSERCASVSNGGAVRRLRLPVTAPLERELRHFARGVRTGVGFLTGLEAGIAVLDVLLAGQASLATGTPSILHATRLERDGATGLQWEPSVSP
jgi:predicted dehydrogenase